AEADGLLPRFREPFGRLRIGSVVDPAGVRPVTLDGDRPSLHDERVGRRELADGGQNRARTRDVRVRQIEVDGRGIERPREIAEPVEGGDLRRQQIAYPKLDVITRLLPYAS